MSQSLRNPGIGDASLRNPGVGNPSVGNSVEPDARTLSMRTLLVDDELLARLALRQALASHGDVEIVGECGTGAEAVTAIAVLHPDIVFLDIAMPDGDGFAALQALPPDARPIVVFVTAFSTHALRAFDAHAIDYVLKPLDQARFDDALARVRTYWRGRQPCVATPAESEAHAASLPSTPGTSGAPGTSNTSAAGATIVERLSVRMGERMHVLRVADIDWFSAEGNYVSVHARGLTYLHRETLAHLEQTLDPARFLRIHRGTIVNLERVTEIHPLFYGACELRLRDGSRLTLSRRFRARARQALGLP